MLYMIIIKASKNSENGKLPKPELIAAMDAYNDALIEAGIRVMAKGLHPTKEAIRFSYPIPDEKPVKTYGPFPDPSNLIAGFFLIDVKSKEEALYWAERVPDPQGDGEGQIELREVY